MINKLKSAFKNLKKRPFVRNVIIMASGTAAAQAIGMALSPVITRLYGPEAFGMMGVFTAAVMIISPVAALTYPIAIVLPRKNSDATGLIRLSLYIAAAISVMVGLILLFFNESIARLFRIEDIAVYLYLIPLVILFAGFLQVAEQWLIRTQQFSITARVKVMHAIILQGSKVGMGFFHPVAAVLIVLTVLGQALNAFMLILSAKRAGVRKPVKKEEEAASLKELADRHRDFPKYRAPEALISAVSQNLPVLMLSTFFGPAAAGFYSIGRTVLNMPTQLIGKSVGDVFYPRISEAANKGENLTYLIKKATNGLAVVAAVPFGLVFLFGPWLFSFVFGADWQDAGEYARWMALWSFFGFMNRPSVRALPVLSAQAFHLKYTIVMLVIRLGALAVGYYVFSSDLAAIALFGISGSLLNAGLILCTLNISKKFDAEREGRK
ncbi:lipopolysaccharide biosynthesis protein [Alteribacillus sp. HJP-4]|uniref:lipopolysaccharide biosynthesis protein n=1 Tax=Alteribacillus sp. HJP-4 TaxID=2775394 RepID=UPI0035CCD448